MDESMDIFIFMREVEKELKTMRDVGMRVPAMAFITVTCGQEMMEYCDMSVSDRATLLIELS